ncbi:amino acid adenylation domain-containing protein [Burkholderia stagnalis]
MDHALALKIATRFVALPARERRLFADKMREQGVTFAHLPVPRSPRDAALPLSHAQQRLWFLWNLQPDSHAYHIDGALTLTGRLDVDALRGSFDAIVARHEALRTTFRIGEDGNASQHVDADVRYDFRIVDVVGRDDADAATATWARSLAAEPFDLTAGPLLRIGVARLAEERHVLVVVMHHIVSDGWSVGVLLREFVDGYRARAAGASRPHEADAPPIQYADYAIWQRCWLEAGELERQLVYWRDRLGGPQPVLALPADRPRQAVGAYHARAERIALPPDVSDGLRRAARAHGATPFMVLLAAFHALLHRYTGETDIRVGVPVANRNRIETEGLIGFFVNTQVLKAELDGRTTLAALLDQVKARALEAQAHQDLPFDALVDALQPERSLSHTPLFQVMFNHQRSDRRALDTLPGLSIEPYVLDHRAAQFELVLETDETPDGALSANLQYACELFDAATMQRFGRHYVRMLAAFGGDLRRGIDTVDLLDDAERAGQLAAGRNDAVFADTRPVHELIRAQADATPDAIAVMSGDAALTYRELDTRANRLAHRLTALGVGREARVGIAVERSLDMIVGLLAILKAGGAYVPLDPEYPRERLSYMMEDSGIALLLTQARVRERLSVPAGVVALDLDTLDVSTEAATAPDVAVHGEQIAYMIYTSGSTGRPKGVMVRHAALTNFLLSTRETPGLTPSDRLVAVTSLSFDIAALELYLPLVAGARSIIASRDAARDGRELAHLLRACGATAMQSTPSTWRMLLDSGWSGGALKGLCGGEALPADLARALRDAGVVLWNMYGPTETTIWSSAQCVDTQPSLGQPLAATQFLVLDAGMQLVPTGAAGELYIGGAGVARGYWQRAALSAERFVPNPFSSAGERLYRTGDLVRWTAGGALDYLGRIDHQVKVRGFRIELGEIDALLVAQPAVRESVVTAVQGPTGTRLVAYVTARDGHAIDGAALRTALAAALPDYMVPAAIVVLDALPLTPNGKIDRRALPAPVFESAGHAAPRGATETALAEIWRDVLQLDAISRDDSFFLLGGHSLQLMQVAMRIERDLGVRLPLRVVFEHPVLTALAQEVDAACAAGSAAAASTVDWPALRPGEPAARTLLAPSQLRLWMADRLAGPAGAAAYNMSAAVRLTGALDAARVASTIEALAARHDVLRTVYPAGADGEPVAVVHDAVRVDLAQLDVSGLAPDARAAEVERLIRERGARPIDIASGPIFDAALIRCDAQEHVLVFTIHHIASDGWSMGVLTRDFSALYRAVSNGEPGPAPLPVRYADYAAWQRELLTGPAHAPLQAFWRDALAGMPAEPPFAGDFPRAAAPSQDGATVRFTLGAPLRARIERLAAELNVTAFTVLLASFQLFVHRRAGTPDLVIGTDVAGRPLAELHELVGFFVNVVPLRSRFDTGAQAASFAERVASVRDDTLRAFEHEALPFDRIADVAQVRRDRRWHPLVQLLFVLQNAPLPDLDLPGLGVAPVPLAPTHSKFDMALFVSPTSDGWQVDWVYATGLFRHATIETFASSWQALLEELVNHPDIPLADAFAATDAKAFVPQAGADRNEQKAGKLKGLSARKRPREEGADAPAVQVERPLVRTSTDAALGQLPVFVEPNVSDLDPIAWASANRRFIDELLQRHAMILFRNFNLPDPRAFEAFAEAMSPGLYGGYGDLPKKEGGERTYKSTPYPEKEMILFHNESSHLDRWPRKQWFYCELPSKVGGATPVVDCRRMLRELPAGMVEKFERLSLSYVRTFTTGLDVPWQAFFKTDSRDEVEARCRAAGMDWAWLDNNELQIRTAAPAVITHPQTGERCFFNQIQLHHPYFLKPEVRADLLKMVGAARLPRSVRYGDGSEIEEPVLAELSRAYEACAIRFAWQPGDVAMLDNMLAAHARDPYEEPRKIVVAMGEMVDGRDVDWNRPAYAVRREHIDDAVVSHGEQAR